MKLTPKITSPVTAIRLKHDVLAEKGQWLLIMDDERIEVMDDAKVRATFNVETSSPSEPPPPVTTPKRVNRVQRRSYEAEINGKHIRVPGQLGRVLVAADKLAKTRANRFQTNALFQYLEEPDRTQASARITDAVQRGLMIHDTSVQGTVKSWALTNEGFAIARAIAQQAN